MIIRRLTCFDLSKIKKLVSYLCNEDNDRLAKSLLSNSLNFINALMPISLKFRPESFIIVENNEILGLITISYTPGNYRKVNITRLIFKENNYEIAKKLVEFVINKIGGKGACSFVVSIDECHQELFDLFINGCGFRHCSSEVLWKIENPSLQKTNFKWRCAQKSDSVHISELYNDELISIYKPSLQRFSKEFEAPLFEGFSSFYKNRYITENDKKVVGYYSITTSDNHNFILDITTNSGYDICYDDVINKMISEISSKGRNFYPFIKQKKYLKESEKLGEFLQAHNFIPIQTTQILVKDYYKPITQESNVFKIFVLEGNKLLER